MTNTYNTLNPLGSTSAKDLSDNASNFDEGMNSLSTSFYDRFKRRRETWAGMEKMVQDFLEAMGFEATHLTYVDGTPLTVLRPTQLIDRAGSVYKVKQPASFPFNLTGTWATDQLLLVDVGDSSLRSALASATGSSMIGFKGPGAGEVLLTAELLLLDAVSVRRFGAVCDGVADDTVAVQKTVDYCAANNWPPMEVPGPCRLTASINIDRMVDTTTSEFRIVAKGPNAGFYVTTNIEMFTSTIAMTTSPVSEFVTFEGIRFACDNYLTGPRVLSKKFLRMKFINCYFYKVRFMVTDVYAQSFFFSNCNIRAWDSSWFVADHGFDIDFDGCISEFGIGYLVVMPNGCYSVRFRGGVHEGSGGGLVTAGLARSLLVSGYYGEGNSQSFLEFGAGAPNTNITVIGTWITSTAANVANTNFYEINWSNTSAPVSIGNSAFNGRLHDNSLLPAIDTAANLLSMGDTANLAVYKMPYSADRARGTWPAATSAGTGTFAFSTYRRSGAILFADFSITFGSASGSPVVITGLPVNSVNSIFGGSVTLTSQVGEVYLIGGTGAGNGCTATSFAVCKDKQGTAYTYTELSGDTLTGRLQISI
jgi:hypothetical protein